MGNNLIQNNAKFYQTNILNQLLSYNLYLGNGRKVNLIFTAEEFQHLTGLGQYLKEASNSNSSKNAASIFKSAKNGNYDINTFDKEICQNHFVYDKMENFQDLLAALEINFEIYSYHKNKIFPNEEAKYMTVSKFKNINGKDTTILLFINARKQDEFYIRSFVANPEELKIRNITSELKSVKILYKEKIQKGIQPIVLQSKNGFKKEEFIEKLSPKEIKEREKIEKEIQAKLQLKQKIKQQMLNVKKELLTNAKNELNSAKMKLSRNHTIRNNYTINGLEIHIDKNIVILFDDENIEDIKRALNEINDILEKDKTLQQKAELTYNNTTETKEIPDNNKDDWRSDDV